MVVAVLAHRFAPSSRGLKRAEKTTYGFQRSQQLGGSRTTGNGIPENYDDYHHLQEADKIMKDEHPWQKRASATGHRRKPFRAMALLTSLASDLDVISDWVFFNETRKNDREYRAEWIKNNNNEANKNGQGGGDASNSLPYLIPPKLLNLVLISCIVGTIMWIILATDGRVAAPVLRRFGIDKLSMGVILFLCVILEDIPQVVLTFLIEDYYEEDYLSTFAICNVMASLYDTLIKLAEAIDERNDMVETGVWCRHSIEAAHSEAITAIAMLLPDATDRRITQQYLPNDMLSNGEAHHPQRFSSIPATHVNSPLSTMTMGPGLMVMAPTPLPCLRFLTASLDGTIRLWDNRQRDQAATVQTVQVLPGYYNGHETVCVRTFAGKSQAGVTCLALLGHPQLDGSIKSHISNSDSSYFLSGSQNGTTQLWSIDRGECVKDFQATGNPVSSIAVVKAGSIFVVGYQDGTARLWDAWSGACIALYRGHCGNVRTVCAMGDGLQFVTGSDDRTLRLWNISSATRFFSSSPFSNNSPGAEMIEGPDFSLTRTPVPSDEILMTCRDKQPLHEESASGEIFQGHTNAILCIACMECGTMFVSGSVDRTARLWSVESGACLQIFSGHAAGVSAVAAIDEVTLLTGSFDTSVKVWDALTGICLRTYTGHSAVVTGISVTDDDTTFVTSSADRTVKLWVLTALPTDQQPSRTLDKVLDINDGLCRGYDPD